MTESLYHVFQGSPNSGWVAPELLDAAGGTQIVVGTNLDTRLEVFFIGNDQQVYHVWQEYAGAPGPGFSAKAPFGFAAKTLALGRNLDGRMEFFYTDLNDVINHCWQVAPNSGWAHAPFGTQAARRLTVASNQDGRLEVFYVGLDWNLYHIWQTAPNSGNWDHGAFAGAARELAAVTNVDGRLELFYVGIDYGVYHNWQTGPNSATWAGGTGGATAAGLGGFAKNLAVGINRDARLEIFYIGTDDQVYHDWQTSQDGPWNGAALFGGSAQQLCLCHDQDGRLEMLCVGMDANVYHYWQTSLNGPWSGGNAGFEASYLTSVTAQTGQIDVLFLGYTAPPAGYVPNPGVGSSTNYVLANNCYPLEGVVVTIDVTEEMVCVANGPQSPPSANYNSGFTFQINCYSPFEETSAWQQYVIGVRNGDIIGQINNWSSVSNQVVNAVVSLAAAPDGKIPAGYKLQVLLSEDTSGNILGAAFLVFDATGKNIANKGIFPFMAPPVGSGTSLADAAPIIAFEVDLVGPSNSQSATFSAGAGTITCSASAALTVLGSTPSCAESGLGTAETANSIYGVMPAAPNRNLQQSFGIQAGAKPGASRHLRFRPALTVPNHVPRK